MLDEHQRRHLIDSFTTSHGEEIAMALADGLWSPDHATKADLEALATEADLKAVESRLRQRIDGCATRSDAIGLGSQFKAMQADLDAKLRDLSRRVESRVPDSTTSLMWSSTALVVAVVAAVTAIAAIVVSGIA